MAFSDQSSPCPFLIGCIGVRGLATLSGSGLAHFAIHSARSTAEHKHKHKRLGISLYSSHTQFLASALGFYSFPLVSLLPVSFSTKESNPDDGDDSLYRKAVFSKKMD